MTRHFVFLLSLIVGLTGAALRAGSQSPAGQSSDPAAAADRLTGPTAEVERVERELVAAIVKTDLATYDRIVADDYIAYTRTGGKTTKAEVLASYRSGTRRYSNLTIGDVSVRVFGDTAVLCATTSGTRVEEGGPPVPNVVRYFRVYTMRRGVWRAVMQMVTPLPAPQ